MRAGLSGSASSAAFVCGTLLIGQRISFTDCTPVILPNAGRGEPTAHISGWDNDLWQLASWYREG